MYTNRVFGTAQCVLWCPISSIIWHVFMKFTFDSFKSKFKIWFRRMPQPMKPRKD